MSNCLLGACLLVWKISWAYLSCIAPMSSYSTRKPHANAALGTLVLSVPVLHPLKLFFCSSASCSVIGRDAILVLRYTVPLERRRPGNPHELQIPSLREVLLQVRR
uniref:Putative secreted protein ovary overexpressed n=1 Tax=Rhipicephalus microplus TaxID=6941 RepID=A0A6M2DCW6_RHIMP